MIDEARPAFSVQFLCTFGFERPWPKDAGKHSFLLQDPDDKT